MSIEALIFDVDGTLADTEEAHRQSFNDAFRAHDLEFCWDRELYRDLLQVTGGMQSGSALSSLAHGSPRASAGDCAV